MLVVNEDFCVLKGEIAGVTSFLYTYQGGFVWEGEEHCQ